MDELNKTHELVPIAFEDIPTPEEHAREARKIFRTLGGVAAAFVIVALTLISVALWKGVPPAVVAVFAMMTMNVSVIAFGIGYGVPVGLVSLRRLEIAYRMGYFGLGQNREAVASMKQIAERVKKETAPLPVGRRPVTEE